VPGDVLSFSFPLHCGGKDRYRIGKNYPVIESLMEAA
jgi:hypothetical protein